MTPGPRTHEGARLELSAMPLPADFGAGRDRVLQISNLFTAPNRRRKGDARWLLCEVCVEADANKAVLVLEPRPMDDDAPLDETALESFYRRFGFETMQRQPVVLMARRPR